MKIPILLFFVSLQSLIPAASPCAAEAPRNPFEPFQSSTPISHKSDTPPLQRYPLSQLKLTAIVTNQEGTLFASIEDPHGIGFKVTVGSVIGESRAVITHVTPQGLIIEERSLSGEAKDTIVSREVLLHSSDKPSAAPTLASTP
jgi:Tfp pilus assembly protein PilP